MWASFTVNTLSCPPIPFPTPTWLEITTPKTISFFSHKLVQITYPRLVIYLIEKVKVQMTSYIFTDTKCSKYNAHCTMGSGSFYIDHKQFT